MEEVFLDLHAVNLYGWEREKNPYIIESICRGIDAGDTFPPVPIIRVYPFQWIFGISSESTRYFIEREPAGGHHRAFAHFLKSKPLLCTLVGKVIREPYIPFSIRESTLYPKDATQLEQFCSRIDSRYR